jgi:hypothetical protein
MSDLAQAIDAQITRLKSLWPVLNSRPEHAQEIVQAITRHARKINADDVTHGFSDAIESAPTTGWPPGPHEVLGCVMARSHTRKRSGDTRPTRFGMGLTFHEWWATVPAQERPKHAALHKLITKEEPVLTAVETPAHTDEIQWEEAA